MASCAPPMPSTLPLLGLLIESKLRSRGCYSGRQLLRDYAARELNAFLWIALIAVTFFLLRRVVQVFRLWSQGSKISGPPSPSFYGHCKLFSRDNFADVLSGLHEKYGSIFKLWLGPTQLLVSIKDPQVIKEILVKAEDKLPLTGRAYRLAFGRLSLFTSSCKEAQNRRKLLAADLNSRLLKRVGVISHTVLGSIEGQINAVMAKGSVNNENISKHMAFTTLGVTLYGETFLSWSKASLYEELLSSIAKDACLWASYNVSPFWRRGFWEYRSLCSKLRCLTQEIIQLCSKNHTPCCNFNQKLPANEKTLHGFPSDEMHSNLCSSEELSGNIMGVMFHGYLTTAGLICNVLERLAKHPEVQDQIYSDIIMERKGSLEDRKLVYDIPLLTATVYESARLLPASPLLQRCSLDKDLHLKSGITLPAGAMLVVPVQLVQMDSSCWGKDATEFNPYRFLSSELAGGDEEACFRQRPFVLNDLNAHPAFLLFGSGARACVGEKFVIHEVVSLLASLLEHYEIRLHPRLGNLSAFLGCASLRCCISSGCFAVARSSRRFRGSDMSDIRKWFMKSHNKGNGKSAPSDSGKPPAEKPQPEKPAPVQGNPDGSARRKTSKYFTENQKPKEEKETDQVPAKRKPQDFPEAKKSLPLKKPRRTDDDDDDFVPASAKNTTNVTPSKKLKTSSGRGISRKSVEEESDEEDAKDTKSPLKPSGRGRGGRGASTPAGGRGRGGSGRGAFMNFGERKDPPHKGEKEIPEGTPDCLAGLTFVISGTLDSLEREEAEDLIKRHGGRVTGSVSKKTNYLLCDEDIEGRKSSKAKELGTSFLTEDGLLDMVRASVCAKASGPQKAKNSAEKVPSSLAKGSPQKIDVKKESKSNSVASSKGLSSSSKPPLPKNQSTAATSLIWTEKYRPKIPNDIIGNQSLVTQLHNWLAHWNEQFLDSGKRGKGKKQNDSNAKKAVLLSGSPGIGKTTSAKVVCKMLGFEAVEVNASDSRGKADSKISKGISGSNANSIKELVSNESLGVNMDWSKHPKSVLIMDEVDGMSAGDRGGVADLIASIKLSKIPIICICNDRYSQKLKSLVNYCLPLNFRRPTKQQMAKRLMQIANAEGLQVNETALEELAERVHGDMRMALNQLQYMSLSMSVIKYDDVKQRLLSSTKDEDISPFTAVDKLFGFNGGKLRMDERIDLSMSDSDLVPLLIQENYINYRPTGATKDDNGLKRMSLIARAAESIADGDIVNVQIRRYRQWQLSQTSCLSSSIIPAALLHGQREVLEQGERNFNRFGGWLGKNSALGKQMRLLDNLHDHVLASRESNSGRETLRVEYLSLLLNKLTDPLKTMPKDEAVAEVVEFMNAYSMNQEDFETVIELSKFKGRPNPLEGVPPATKAALTRAYNESSKFRMVRAADLVTLPGPKKATKKRAAPKLEPSDGGLGDENGEALVESEEDDSSETDDQDAPDGEKLQMELEGLKSKAVQVQLDLKRDDKPGGKRKASAGTGRGGSASSTTAKRGRAQTSASASKRKR
ncbi:hypothetical protein SAY87_009762 [Trapa incisa]|uniref:Replication factor C subunit 1 n=1 Tax=Trapa incisa TaxID=236973 RepID=A0AAN7Q391_9MYRT|nr:hypothetical protein SAY87_009762 [Trapa incisa]